MYCIYTASSYIHYTCTSESTYIVLKVELCTASTSTFTISVRPSILATKIALHPCYDNIVQTQLDKYIHIIYIRHIDTTPACQLHYTTLHNHTLYDNLQTQTLILTLSLSLSQLSMTTILFILHIQCNLAQMQLCTHWHIQSHSMMSCPLLLTANTHCKYSHIFPRYCVYCNINIHINTYTRYMDILIHTDSQPQCTNIDTLIHTHTQP
jgi:hypothetical protein